MTVYQYQLFYHIHKYCLNYTEIPPLYRHLLPFFVLLSVNVYFREINILHNYPNCNLSNLFVCLFNFSFLLIVHTFSILKVTCVQNVRKPKLTYFLVHAFHCVSLYTIWKLNILENTFTQVYFLRLNINESNMSFPVCMRLSNNMSKMDSTNMTRSKSPSVHILSAQIFIARQVTKITWFTPGAFKIKWSENI